MFSLSLFVVQFPISLRLNRLLSDNLFHPESRDSEQLRKEVADNVSVFLFVGEHVCKCMNDDCVTEYCIFFFHPAKWSVQTDSWGPEGAKDQFQVRSV